jgi:hypothetical protein
MTFGIAETAGSAVIVSVIAQAAGAAAGAYSTVPKHLEEGKKNLREVFDTVEKYGDMLEQEDQEYTRRKYHQYVCFHPSAL